MSRETVDDNPPGSVKEPPVPGFVLIFCAGRPVCRALRVGAGFDVGRDVDAFAEDERLSRRHVRIEPSGPRLRVRDLGSRNGTFVDGQRVDGEYVGDAARVVRAGRSVMVAVADVRPFETNGVKVGPDAIVGPTLAAALEPVSRASVTAATLLVRGESGSGKERVAHAFHALGPAATGPFVAVNCATLPEGVAERLLFGARRGAYSGATDTEGLVRTAHGGVLFLDEIGELELEVQAKLLRVLETREILALGANKPTRVDVRYVFATHRDLRADAASGRFRPDLFYRIEQPSVVVPPLRARPEEFPQLIASALGDAKPSVHASFLEACLLRPWPGNVRELLGHVHRAVEIAVAASATELLPEHLDADAGLPLSASHAASGSFASARDSAPGTHPLSHDETAVREALRTSEGNVSAAARSLGLHRTQLRRLLEKFGIDRPE